MIESKTAVNNPVHLSVLLISPPGRWRASLGVLLHACPNVSRVYPADNCAAALAVIGATVPHLVLLDGGLPGEDAWPGLAQIRRTWPEIRCIVLAHDSAQEQHARQLGAEHVLQVGFSGEALYAMIRQLNA